MTMPGHLLMPSRSLPRRWFVRLVMALLLIAPVALAAAVPAQAHASVVSSSPATGARLAHAPAAVTITFDEPVGLDAATYLNVVDGSGKQVQTGRVYHPAGRGQVVAVNLPSSLAPGAYVESWRVISADSHPVTGTIEFAVGDARLAPPKAAKTPVDKATGVVFAVIRFIGFVGLMVMGGVWLPLTCWPTGRSHRRTTRLLGLGWSATAIAAIAGFLVQGPYAAGRGLAEVTEVGLIGETWHSVYGMATLARLMLLVAVAALFRRARSATGSLGRYRWSIAVGAVLLAGTYSIVGHPRTTDPAWLSVGLDDLHILSSAAWLGALVLLLIVIAPARDVPATLAALPAISRVSMVSVTLIAVTGTYAAWRGIAHLDALSTTYAVLVGVKVALFVVTLGVANWSRRAVGRRLGRTADDPHHLRRLVGTEVAIAAAILVATSALVTQPRGPEAVAAQQQQPVTRSASLGPGRAVRLTIDPGTHGQVTAFLTLTGDTTTGRDQLTVTAALPSAQLGPIPLRLSANGPHQYSASGVVLPRAGRWVFTVVDTVSEFDAVTTAITLPLS